MSHLYLNEESDYSEENTCDNEVFCPTIVSCRFVTYRKKEILIGAIVDIAKTKGKK